MNEVRQYTLDELKKKLTAKERIFCHQYIIDWNGARSAREAGYSEETAKEIASQNLTKLHIQQYIAFIKNNIEEECGISKMKVIKELSKIAFSSIAHLHNTWIERTEFEQLTDDQKASIESIDTKIQKRNIGSREDPDVVDVEYVKIKLYSKLQASDLINKMMGYNMPEKKEITGKDGEPLIQQNIDLTKYSDDELRTLADLQRKGGTSKA